jgi:sugar lactone lactonase YvrE
MSPTAPDIQAVTAPALLGESALWHPQEQVLYYCDIPGRSLHRFDPGSGASQAWQFETHVASCAPIAGSRDLLLAMRDGLWRFDPVSGRRELLAAPPYDVNNERFNDGKCDPQGRFWVGTIYEPREPALAALYRYHRGELLRMADGITVSNGLAWSPTGRTMYWSDTKAHTIYTMDFNAATGVPTKRQVFASFAHKQPGQDLASYGGRPDGAAVDAQGCYWVAMFEGARVLRLSPAGEVLQEVKLPVRCPTMPCFGGADMQTLYITTSREKRPDDELVQQPLAGCTLALRVDVPGLPAHSYRFD